MVNENAKPMRILLSSNSPFAATGYGCQANVASRRLRALGHEVAILCFWGLAGSKTEWGDITLYPNNTGDYGVADAPMIYDDFKADIFITLVDAWVLKGMDPALRWFPWFPVDHDPIPPLVLEALKSPGIVRPIAMSKFGVRQCLKHGIDPYYIPHSVNTKLYRPDPEMRAFARKGHGWEDKFVIGTVATNHSERKNWNAGMQAVAKFEARHPGKIIYYMHTNLNDKRGINLAALRENLKMQSYSRVPSIAQMNIGIPEDTMATMYSSLDVFLLPTKGEGFGIPLIESQASGVPVITTNCTAQSELVGGGWYLENLRPVWTAQSSYQFDCDVDEIVEKLEIAYKAWEDGSIEEERKKAREKAMEYDEDLLFGTYWPSVLADVQQNLNKPRNMEGVQKWRLAFIPQNAVPRKVLDAGSGLTAPYKRHLEHLGEYVAVDSRADGSDGIVQADIRNLPYRDKEFGFVWCSEVLEHLENPEKAVSELKRVGLHGVVLFSTPQTPSFHIDPDHKVVNPDKVKYITLASGDGMLSW